MITKINMGGEKPGGAASNKPPRIQNLPERPKAPQAEAVAKTLTTPQSAEAKADEIVDELWRASLAVMQGRGLKLFKENSSPNILAEALTPMKIQIRQEVKSGAEFVGYSDGGMVLNWFKNGKREMQINKAFLQPKVQAALNDNGKAVLRKKQLEVAEFTFAEAAKAQAAQISEHLKGAGLIAKNLSKEKILVSDFGKELIELLVEGYRVGAPFIFTPSADGFVLKNYFGKFKDEPFDMRRFDKNLNYPRETTEQKTDRYIAEKILPFLRGVRPGLSDEKMLNSWLIQEEIKPVVFAGYKGGKPYEFVKEGSNFRLKCKAEGFKDQVFNMGDYDQDLNLLNPKSEPVTAGKETQVVQEGQKASGHHEDREIFQIKTDKYIGAYSAAKALQYAEQKPDTQGIHKVIDEIVKANPAFSAFSSEMKDLAGVYMEQLEAGKSEKDASDAMEATIGAELNSTIEGVISSGDKDMQAGFSVFKDLTRAIAYPRETTEQKTDRYIAEKILPFLRGVRPGLSDEKMLNSWLIQEEIKPVVFAGYKGGKPYEFVKEGSNFRLKCKAEGFKDQVFNMGDYDQDLNLLNPKSEPVTAGKETQVVQEGQKASGHHGHGANAE